MDEAVFLTTAILLPDMSDGDWDAECKAMFERNVALDKFFKALRNPDASPDNSIDDLLDLLEHYGIKPEEYCQEVDEFIETLP